MPTKASASPTNTTPTPKIEMLPLRSVKPYARNARTHSKAQIQQIAASIRRFGNMNPIVIDDAGVIVCGHGRFEACKHLKLTEVPVIRAFHLTPAEIAAFRLADNKLAEKSGWDRELLSIEIQDVQVALPELDLTIIGFDTAEIDSLIMDHNDTTAEPDSGEDELEVKGPAVARTGELFMLGKHRLLVGDARQSDCFERLMAGSKAQMAFLDPPFNLKVQGQIGGRGRVRHAEFACASGEMTSTEFEAFLKQTLGACTRHLVDGSISYVAMDWRHARELLSAGGEIFTELKNICVWTKSNAGQGSFYRGQHEMIFVFKTGTAAHINNFELGQKGRLRSNVWAYAGGNAFRAGRMDDLKMHPTVKPVTMIADAMKDCSQRGAIVLDCFSGSGSSIAAAERVGRRAYCMEISPLYVDVTIRRWQKITGKDAMLEGTDKTFQELQSERGS